MVVPRNERQRHAELRFVSVREQTSLSLVP